MSEDTDSFTKILQLVKQGTDSYIYGTEYSQYEQGYNSAIRNVLDILGYNDEC